MRPFGFKGWCLLSFGFCNPLILAMALEVQNYQGINYVTGGVGTTEREAITAMAGDFNLKLRFALTTGSYLSNIKVSIQNAEGQTVFEGTSDGPWFLLNLEPGNYTVMASDTNENLQQRARVQRGGSTELVFRFQDK